MNDRLKILAQKVKQAREKCGISQRDLALTVGIDHTVISRMENAGLPRLKAEHANKIAEALGMDANPLRWAFYRFTDAELELLRAHLEGEAVMGAEPSSSLVRELWEANARADAAEQKLQQLMALVDGWRCC